jgi:hypothetical protein
MRSKLIIIAIAALTLTTTAASAYNEVKLLLDVEFLLNGMCRGGTGDDPQREDICDQRDALAKRLGQLGWCYGKRGQSGNQMKWHRCTAGSMKITHTNGRYD